jgi:hypothetical protein
MPSSTHTHTSTTTNYRQVPAAVSIAPQAALNVLQGSNGVNSGSPNALVAKLQASAIGAGMKPLDVAYASVNGAAVCNTCGFQGDVAQQFVGDGACVRACKRGWWVVWGGVGVNAAHRHQIHPTVSHDHTHTHTHTHTTAAGQCATSEAAATCDLANIKIAGTDDSKSRTHSICVHLG